MHPEIIGRMAAQRGLITRPQALAAGLSAREIDRLVRSRVWVAERRGVYVEASFKATLEARPDHRIALRRLADDAACLRVGRDHVRSHDSAAVLLGLDILLPPDALTHVTRPTVQGSRHEFGVKHHLAPYDEARDVVVVGGVRCLRAARTAVDIAREHGHPYGMVAFDSFLRAGGMPAELHEVIDEMTCWPRITVVRSELELADAGSESVGETLARDLVIELGFGRPQTQFGLTDGRRTIWVDLRIGRHLFEFDGRVKYLPAPRGGPAVRAADEVLFEEKRRQDFATGFKLGMSRIVWDDLWGWRREQARSRLTREVLDTNERFGTSIDDLAPYLAGARPRWRAA